MNVLFVCSRNRRRSPTAEILFSDYPGVETASAGTASDAETVISADLIEWADIIFAMEAVHKRRLSEKFSTLLSHRTVVVLGIRDSYDYMSEPLMATLKKKVVGHLERVKMSDTPF